MAHWLDQLRKYKQAKKYTCTKIAKSCNLDRSSVEKLFRKGNCAMYVLIDVAEFLDLRVRYIEHETNVRIVDFRQYMKEHHHTVRSIYASQGINSKTMTKLLRNVEEVNITTVERFCQAVGLEIQLKPKLW